MNNFGNLIIYNEIAVFHNKLHYVYKNTFEIIYV